MLITSNLKRFFVFVLFIVFYFFSFSEVFAVSIVINDSPTTIGSEEFSVSVSVSGAIDGTNYLRIDLFKDGSSNYFGETYNNSSWYSESDGKQYFPVTIKDSTASAIVKGRIGNPTSTEYQGPGPYKLRIRRYTSSGSSASNDSQTYKDVSLTVSIATSEPTTVPTQAPTPIPTSKPKTPSPVPTNKPSTSSPIYSETPESEVLGESSTQTSEPFESPSPSPIPSKLAGFSIRNILTGGLIVGGLILISVAAIGFLKISKNEVKQNF